MHIPARLCWCGDAEQLGVKLAAPERHRQPACASGPHSIAGFDTWLQLFKKCDVLLTVGALYRTLGDFFHLHWRISYVKVSIND